MQESDKNRERYRIGDLELDVGAGRLTRHGNDVSLPKLSFRFLTVLAQAHPDLVSVDQLMQSVWDGAIVNDETVTQRAKLLRDALSQAHSDYQYVETVRGLGYRLSCPVEALHDSESDPAPPTPNPAAKIAILGELRRRRVFQVAFAYIVVSFAVLQGADILVPEFGLPEFTLRLVLALIILGFPVAVVLAWAFQVSPDGVVRDVGAADGRSVVAMVGLGALAISILGGIAWVATSGDSPDPQQSGDRPGVAVLPFKDISPEGDQAYFSDGIHEELLSRLAEVSAFRVPSRTSVEVYRDTDKRMPQIAAELGVDVILEGSTRHHGQKVRITVQLIDPRAEDHLWVGEYDRDLSVQELFEIQRDVATRVATSLEATLSPDETRRIAAPPTTSFNAYDAYLKGLYHGRRYTVDDLRQAIEYFGRAAEIDPAFADAWSGLANTYALAGTSYGWLEPAEAVTLARENAEKALELDPASAATVSLIGDILLWYEWDWAEAEQQYRRAIELEPDHIGSRLSYAYMLSALSRHDEAIEQILTCLELEPASARVHLNAAWRYMHARQYELAIRHANQVLDMDASYDDAYIARSYAYIFSGRLDEVVAGFTGLEDFTELHGYALARAGREAEARVHLERLKHPTRIERVSPGAVAIVLVGLGELDDAFDWIEQAAENRHRSVLLLDTWEVYDPLRSDPRFNELLREIGIRTNVARQGEHRPE